MNDESMIVIRLDGEGRTRRPGETLSGEYWVTSLHSTAVKAIEASVLWQTEGKGDEDLAVIEFSRREAEEDRPLDITRPQRFGATLPNSPLSYDGQLIKVRWCVRVRIFLRRGKEIVAEKAFRLGETSPAKPHRTAAPAEDVR
jgi:hypothetical protein